MQDNYVGDIGDYGKYGLLRNVTAAGLQLAVNWYRVVLPPSNEQDDGECISCSKKPKQKDGKYTSYLEHPVPPPIDMASDGTAGHCRGGCRVPRSGQRPGDRKNA